MFSNFKIGLIAFLTSSTLLFSGCGKSTAALEALNSEGSLEFLNPAQVTYVVNEGEATWLEYEVSKPLSSDIEINFEISPIANTANKIGLYEKILSALSLANSDGHFSSFSGSSTLTAGNTKGHIQLSPTSDQTFDSNHIYQIKLSSSNALNEVDYTLTVQDKDGPPVISILDVAGNRGEMIPALVSLSHKAAQDITISVNSSPGTATSDVDYIFTTNSLTISAGQSSGTLNINALNPFTVGDKYFFITLSNATLGSIDTSFATAKVTILDNTNNANDTVAPTVSLAFSDSSSPSQSSVKTATATFSEPVAGFEATDLNLVNATVSNFNAVSSSVYTFTVTATAQGLGSVQVPAAVAQDIASNSNTNSNQISFIFDNIAPENPTITINSGSLYTNVATVNLGLSANGASEMIVSENSNCGVGNSWQTFSTTLPWTFSDSTDGLKSIYVKYRDLAQNETNCQSATITISSASLTVNLTSQAFSTPRNISSLDVTATFSQNVTGFTQADLSLTNATASSFLQVSGSVYTFTITAIGQGQVGVQIPATVAQDSANNDNLISNSLTFVFDNIAPTSPSITIGPGPSYTNSLSQTLNLAATDAAQMLISTAADCSVGTFESYATTKAYTLPSGDGLKNVYVKFKDSAQNETSCLNASITLDQTIPTVALTPGTPTSPTSVAALNLTATFSEAVTGFTSADLAVTNGTISAFNASSSTVYTFTVTATAQGAVSVQVPSSSAQDSAANNNSASNTVGYTYDSAAPTSPSIAINSGAPYSNTAMVTLGLSAGGATEMYITETSGCGAGGIWESYGPTKSWTFSNTSDGTKNIFVKYRDAAQNESSCATSTIIVDSTPPTVALSPSNPTSPTNSAALNLTATFSEAVTGFTSADLAVTNGTISSFTASSSTVYTFTVTANGQGAVTVQVSELSSKDLANLDNSSSNTVNYIYDNVIPTIALTPGSPSSPTSVAALNLTATFSEAVTGFTSADLSVTNGTISAFNASSSTVYTFTVTASAQGAVSVQVPGSSAQDSAANNNSASNTVSYNYDSIAPTSPSIVIGSGASYTNSLSQTLNLAATDAAQMLISTAADCSVGTFESYATTKAYTLPSGDGLKNVYVKFKDSAQNETSCLNASITLDQTIPTVALTPGTPTSPTSVAALNLTATFSEAVTGFTSADLAVTNGTISAFNASSSTVYTFTVTASAQGAVSVQVPSSSAQDSAANNNSASNTVAYTYDSVAPTSPTISINSGAGFATSTASTLSLSAVNATQMYITQTSGCGSGGSYEAYSTSKSWTLTGGEGTRTVYVKFKDDAGNESSCVNDTIVQDTIAPSAATALADGTYSSSTANSPTLTFTAGSDATSGIQKHQVQVIRSSDSVVMKAFADFTSGNSVSGLTLVSGTLYKFLIRTYDNAGNYVDSSLSDGWTVDNVAPSSPGSVTDGTSNASLSASPTISWSASSDATSGIQYYEVAIGTTAGGTNTANWANVGNVTSTTISGLSLTASTVYYATVRAVDNAGNTSTASNGNGWTATAPCNTTQTFSYTGADQTYTIPAGCNSAIIRAWGAGGGGTASLNGGGAGFVESNAITVTPGATLYVRVGGGGIGTCSGNCSGIGFVAGGFGGGGGAYQANTGGGGSYVATASDFAIGSLLAAAGGGGGGGGGTGGNGGAGGGATGEDGYFYTNTAAKGGTSSAGGAAAYTNLGTSQPGSYMQGGSLTSGSCYGAGGGGGYYGGGSGGRHGSWIHTSGAGGSSFSTSGGTLTSGSGTTPGGTGDANYSAGIGVGGSSGNGGNGKVAITFSSQ